LEAKAAMVYGTGLMQHREHTSRRDVETDTRVLMLLLLMQTTFWKWLHSQARHVVMNTMWTMLTDFVTW